MMKSTFLNNLKNQYLSNTSQYSILINCLVYMLNNMNFNIDWSHIKNLSSIHLDNIGEYEHQLKIKLISIKKEVSDSFYPLLVQDQYQKLYVLLKYKYNIVKLYDPASGLTCTKKKNEFIINKAWQCCFFPLFFDLGFRDLLKILTQYFKKPLLLSFLLGSLVGLSGIVVCFFSGYAFDHLYEASMPHYNIIFYVFASVFLSITLLTFISEMINKSLNFKVLYFIMPSIWNSMLSLSIEKINLLSSGGMTERIISYEKAMTSIVMTLLSLSTNSVALCAIFLYLFYFNAMIAVFLVAFYIFTFLCKLILLSTHIDCSTKSNENQEELSSLLNEGFSQIGKLRSAGAEYVFFKKCLAQFLKVKLYDEKSLKIEIIIDLIDKVVPLAFLIIFCGGFYFSSDLKVSLILQLIICSRQLLNVFGQLSNDIVAFVHLTPHFKRMQSIIQPHKILVKESGFDEFTLLGNITFDKVCLRDKKSDRMILNNISIHIPKGSFIGIVGATGAGKSTLFRLLLGFEQVSSGIIAFEGTPMNYIHLDVVRKQLGVVLQTSALFPGTILSNITVGSTLSYDEVMSLVQAIDLKKDIDSMPMKLHTYVSDTGDSVSGGQRQKILLARALAAKPTLLLLDEATSALDRRSQSIVYDYLKKIQMTRIVIAHRYSTLRDADLIYWMEKGSIIDQGRYYDFKKKYHWED